MKADDQLFCLTSGQRWLLHLFEQGRELARPVQRVYQLHPAFDDGAFLEALEQVVSAHPALSLRLVNTAYGWRQYFPDQPLNISGEEIQGRTPEMRAAYASMLLAEEGKATMDLREEAPVKAKLIRSDGEYLLSICIDHIAADEMAFDLFEQALLTAYTKNLQNEPYQPETFSAFPEYLQKEAAQAASEPDHLRYWQQQLQDAPLFGDTNDELSWKPATVFHHQLNGQGFASLQDFCRTNRCSLFNLLLAAQLMVMAEARNTDDLVVNLPVSNRAKASEKQIIANLSMLLHVRFTEIRSRSASQLLTYVRDQVLNAMAYRQYDYPSLSKYIVEVASNKGVHANWLLGCNYVVEQNPMTWPNELFAERLDNLPDRVYDVPASSFSSSIHQSAGKLRILIDWDQSAWPVTAEALHSSFLSAINTLTKNY